MKSRGSLTTHNTAGSISRNLVPRAMVALAVLGSMAAVACSVPKVTASAPSSHCADLVAKAVTSYFNIGGSGRCLVGDDGSPTMDAKLAAFTVDPPPVFDHIDRSCGYQATNHTFIYLASNSTDRAAGRIEVVVVDTGLVTDVAKHLDRKPGASTRLLCPGLSGGRSFL